MTAPDGRRIPEPPSEAENEGVPDTDQEAPGDALDGYGDEEVMPPRDRPLGVTRYGTTAREEIEGESLDQRIAEEEPDVLNDEATATDGDDRDDIDPVRASGDGYDVGRLVEDDEGAGPDETPEAVAHSAGIDRGGFTAEESAMHIDPDS
jgi:hypothetical protein